MTEREIARELARLREELAELGADAPRASHQTEVLGRSIAMLRTDLAAMRDAAHPGAADAGRNENASLDANEPGLSATRLSAIIGESPTEGSQPAGAPSPLHAGDGNLRKGRGLRAEARGEPFLRDLSEARDREVRAVRSLR